MGKNIIVQTDGVSHTYNGVEEIHTQDKDGNRTTWVPLDGTNLGVKTITQSGTYKASDDGYYAYSKVIVDAKAKAVGKKEDGKTYAIASNDQGETVEILLPDYIKIETNPAKMSYNEGESINLAGSLVRAYCDDGSIWQDVDHLNGIIPVSELHPAPQKASTTVSIVSSGSVEYTSDLVSEPIYRLWGLVVQWVDSSGSVILTKTRTFTFLGNAIGVKVININSTSDIRMFFTGVCEIETTTKSENTINGNVSVSTETEIVNADEIGNVYTHDGKDIKTSLLSVKSDWLLSYNGYIYNQGLTQFPAAEYLWTLEHGTPIQTTPATQRITVLWSRPEDNMALSDTFNVSVNFVND